jgi:hypothetical protein
MASAQSETIALLLASSNLYAVQAENISRLVALECLLYRFSVLATPITQTVAARGTIKGPGFD